FSTKPLAAPAVAQRHGDRPLGLGLADDMRVERGDDRLGGECVFHFHLSPSRQEGPSCSPPVGRKKSRHASIVSTVTRSLVKTQTSAATCMARRAIRSASSS